MVEVTHADREADVYRPVAGLAIAGFGLAALFALGLTIVGGIALSRGSLLLLHPALFIVPVAAFILSLLGAVQIRRSEGARAGARLANWGMLLSFLFGAGYLSWSTIKERLVKEDAQQFTAGWLERIRTGRSAELDTTIAFWNTLDPERRDPQLPLDNPQYEKRLRDNPQEYAERRQNYLLPRFAYGAGYKPLPAFLEHELVQFLRHAGPELQIEPRGVRAWTYRPQGDGAYLVEQNYRFTTAEGNFDAVIAVLGGRRGARGGPQWQVLMEATELAAPDPRQLNDLGRNVVALRADSRDFARDWTTKLSKGQLTEAYLATRPAVDRPALRQQARYGPLLGVLHSAPGSLPLLDGEAFRLAAWPGYAEFSAGGLVSDRELLMEPNRASAVLAELKAHFNPRTGGGFIIETALPNTRLASPWQMQGSEAVFRHPVAILLARHRFEGWLLIATDNPTLLAGLTTPPAALTLPAGTRPLRWRVAGLELTIASLPQE